MKLSDPDLLQTAEPLYVYHQQALQLQLPGRRGYGRGRVCRARLGGGALPLRKLFFNYSSFNVPRLAARRRTGMTCLCVCVWGGASLSIVYLFIYYYYL
jgi:hypothetical protein